MGEGGRTLAARWVGGEACWSRWGHVPRAFLCCVGGVGFHAGAICVGGCQVRPAVYHCAPDAAARESRETSVENGTYTAGSICRLVSGEDNPQHEGTDGDMKQATQKGACMRIVTSRLHVWKRKVVPLGNRSASLEQMLHSS